MKLLFDFIPILIFFISYKFFGIYSATAIAMIASILQVIYYRLKHHSYEKAHLISLGFIIILGGATLFFHNPWFIKWKPTGLYWLGALIFLISTWVGNKPIIQKMMDNNIILPQKIWYRLNWAWVLFFLGMGSLNLFVAYTYNTDIWVNFKLFGSTGLTIFFVIIQAIYLTRHSLEKNPPISGDS